MTALILLENYKFNDYITTKYPINYENKGKVANIPSNTEISIENLLKFLLIYSANDAAYIAALSVSNNLDEFINLMNDKAEELNMNNTKFTNPDGIDDENHYTTLNDLLILSLEVVKNLEIVTVVSKTSFISDITGKETRYESTNMLIEDGFVGLKTGWTDKAGLTFIGLNQNNNREIITIVNKSKVDENKYSHFSDTKLLYKTSIEIFQNFNIINKYQNLYIIRNGNTINYYKNQEDWSAFANLNKNYNLKYKKISDNNIYFQFDKYENSYKLINSKYKIKWKFDPLKLFQLIASQ